MGYGLFTNLTIISDEKYTTSMVTVKNTAAYCPIKADEAPITGDANIIAAITAVKQHGHGAIIAAQVALA